MTQKIPVILDTDIGSDIDDTWAIAMMLKCPELDVKLIVSDTHDTVYRAKLVARLLEVAARTDIPVGVGLSQNLNSGGQAEWVKGYELDHYPGTVHADGVDAMIGVIMNAPQPVTLLCIGPMPNIAEALKREPGIARKARFVGMHGSIKTGYGEGEPPAPEYNVVVDVPSCKAVFDAPWLEKIITPLDTCGRIRLNAGRYRQLKSSPEPLLKAVFENYLIWAKTQDWVDPQKETTVLFDTVAVHLAYSTRFLKMERMGVTVTEKGLTVPDPAGPQLDIAMEWSDLEGYKDYLVERLTGPVVR